LLLKFQFLSLQVCNFLITKGWTSWRLTEGVISTSFADYEQTKLSSEHQLALACKIWRAFE
jgi:hypothetical protein